ncbi:hypothetical protein S7335_555 [Synechococcus sp. PCC 7335]|uniref:hypothetical protein n=1 Tax=Synechococcus sp. (strain ATCC 29403 / PCC 7335) TaxID=91464 RepID=UPI00017EB90E|nr:hypothetical protein [Synechococcus sp. PCC 7335]EDX83375.1 hypothetical protein S7335_555 [Synechococcus sp. PCC 7335]
MSAQVEMVLNMLRPAMASLTSSERNELLAALTDLLCTTSSDSSASRQVQSNSVSGLTFGEGNSAFNFSPIQSQEGNVSVSPNFNQASTQNAETRQVIEALADFKQTILENKEINPLLQDMAREKVEKLEEELKKTEPDKSLVKHTITTLRKGLEGVLTLAEPTMKVASLIAKVWGIPVV